MERSGAPGIRRHFVTVGDRQVHYRRAGTGPPVVLLHGTPGSSLSLVPLARALAGQFCTIALDLPGCGSSEPLATAAPTAAHYADAVSAALTELGIAGGGLYGEHVGAAVALELARRRQSSPQALVLRDLPLFAANERRDWTVPKPRIDGSHLLSLWTRVRDQFLFSPWYRRENCARRSVPMPHAARLHDLLMDLLRAGAQAPLPDAAAMGYESPEALLQLEIPTAIVSLQDDVLASQLARLPDELPPTVVVERHSDDSDRLAGRIVEFLGANLANARAPAVPSTRRPPDRVIKDYVSTTYGQLMIRQAGTGDDGDPPLVMLHASPGSAEMLVPLMKRLAQGRRVIALDMLGNGDSDKPPWESADAWDYAPVVAEVIDALGLDHVDLYGNHTGAAIALELCLSAPGRVRRLVLDGVPLFGAAEREDILAHYTLPLEPSDEGTHLVFAWSFLRDQSLFWPWYNRTVEGIRWVDPIDAESLHVWLVELLKSGHTYPIAYRAAFSHPTRERLPLLTTPTLMVAHPSDMLHDSTMEAAGLAQRASATSVAEDLDSAAAVIAEFLGRDA